MQKRKIIFPILTILFLVLTAILFSTSIYYGFYYGEVDPEQLFYTLTETKSASPDVVWVVIGFVGIPGAIISLFWLYLYLTSKDGFEYKKTYNKTIRIISLCLSIVLFLTGAYVTLDTTGIIDYIEYSSVEGTFIEEQYINPKTTEIKFPDEKRNLIVLFAESMESSYTLPENGGFSPVDLIPELAQLANENTHFSNTDKLGGALRTYGTTWTTAGITATTFGLPLKIAGNQYGIGTNFLPQAYSMFEILKDNGYDVLTMKGSDIEFGGMAQMMKDHGNIDHWDYFSAIEEGKISKDYFQFWGFEDAKLFEYLKERLTIMASQDEPFATFVETVDTHYPNGYRCNLCGWDYGRQYSDVIRCSSKQIYAFIEWAKIQEWYDNTTIVIVGDHLTMKADYFDESVNEKRTTYNVFINSVTETNNTKNRQFSTIDMFPTILASIGCEIDGDKLGLGTNLFSKSQTLFEEFGFEFVNDELKKKSNFYTNNLM